MAERRRRIAQEDRERIVRAFEEPEQDYLVVADTLGVHRATARGIVARFIRENRVDERPRGGRNNVKVNEEMRQCLEAILEENPMLTFYQSKIKRGTPGPSACSRSHSCETFRRNVVYPEVGTYSSSRP